MELDTSWSPWQQNHRLLLQKQTNKCAYEHMHTNSSVLTQSEVWVYVWSIYFAPDKKTSEWIKEELISRLCCNNRYGMMTKSNYQSKVLHSSWSHKAHCKLLWVKSVLNTVFIKCFAKMQSQHVVINEVLENDERQGYREWTSIHPWLSGLLLFRAHCVHFSKGPWIHSFFSHVLIYIDQILDA